MLNFSVIGTIYGICGKKIFRWYKNSLSGFETDEVQKKLHKNDTVDISLIDRITGDLKTVFTPILNLRNLGMHMAIDDKEIAGEGYTIILNRDTKKIFLMISTRKFKIIKKVLSHIPLSRFLKVKTITKDLASNYDWLARTVFPQAVRIADKFHVLKLGFEAMQDVRVRFRQEVLTAEKEKKKSSKNKKKKKEKKIPEKYKKHFGDL